MSYINPYNLTNVNARNDAYKAQLVLDSFYKPNEEGVKTYAKHLQNSIDNPAAGMLISENIINDSGINYPRTYSRNRHLLHKNSQIDKLIDEFNAKVKNDYYPNTWEARDFIIKKRRVVLDDVRPIKHNFSRTLFRIYNTLRKNIKRLK